MLIPIPEGPGMVSVCSGQEATHGFEGDSPVSLLLSPHSFRISSADALLKSESSSGHRRERLSLVRRERRRVSPRPCVARS